MKKLLVIIFVLLLTACSKGTKAPDQSECFIQKDRIMAENAKLKEDVNFIRLNMESNIKMQVESQQKELYSRIESYNQFINDTEIENQSYRKELRMIVMFGFLGILICIIIVNYILFKKYKQQKLGKKLYEE